MIDSKAKLVSISGIALIMVVLFSIFFVQSYQNGAINHEEQVASAKSKIKIQEKRRIDLIGNLVDCVKEYDKHEAEVLQSIVEGRSKESEVENVQTYIQAIAEAYPELKSNDNYKQLMLELSTTENLIANYRNNYNDAVKTYNAYCKKFPHRTFLGCTGYQKQSYEYLDYEVSKDAPKNLFGEK